MKLYSRRRRILAFFALVMLILPFVANAAEPQLAAATDEGAFAAVVQPFFTAHCVKCHGPDKANASIRLDRIDDRIAMGYALEDWSAIAEQLESGTMPPEDDPNVRAADRDQVLTWIRRGLELANTSDRVRDLNRQFSYGNTVDHDTLFSGAITDLPYSPPRMWRMNPHIYERTKKRIFKGHWEALRRARQPFPLDDREGVSDYAAAGVADSATLETLLRNARGIVDHQLTHDVPMEFRAILELVRKADEAANETAEKADIKKDTPAQLSTQSPIPTAEQIDAAVRHQFETLVYRLPTEDEKVRYRELITRSMDKAGVVEGLRVGLKAIALTPESIYRMELGLGQQDEHRRRFLSPNEIAFAVAFALTDDPPDEALYAAAQAGKIRSREDVTEQVERILADATIAKPRILRFFQEFFGYDRATNVFKDAERYENYDWGVVPVQLIHEADLLVLHILERDEQVLKELLTTEKYFVGHIGATADPQDLKGRLDALRLLYDYWKDKPWKELEYELEPETRSDIEGLHPYFQTEEAKHRMSGGLVKDYMEYLTICYQNKIRPMLAQFIYIERYDRERNLTSAHDQRFFLSAYNLEIDKFDCPVEQPFVLNPKQRVGILTHPAWLIAHSKNTDTNPITRGKWVRERLLAGHVPDIPITVDAVVPEDKTKTLRERFVATRQTECWRCHQKMNPLGMPFEMFDDFGRYRTKDKVSGKPIDASGAVDSTGEERLDGKVANAVELVHRLAESKRVRQSFVRHAFRYWMGRNEMLSDSATLITADQAYVESNGSFQALLVSLLTSESFLYRKEATEETKKNAAEKTPRETSEVTP